MSHVNGFVPIVGHLANRLEILNVETFFVGHWQNESVLKLAILLILGTFNLPEMGVIQLY